MLRSFVWVWMWSAVLQVCGWAQQPRATPPAEIAAAAPSGRPSYADEPTVTERYDTVYQFHADGTGSKLDTRVVRIQNGAGLRVFAVLNVPFPSGFKRVEFVAVKVHKRGGGVVTTPPGEAQDQPSPVAQAAPAYSNLHAMLLGVRGLAVGDTLEYQVRTVTTQPEVRDQFWGADGFEHGRVVLERTVELRVPASKNVQVSSPKYPPEVSEEKDEKVYRWTGSQPVPTVRAKAAATEPSAADAQAAQDVVETTPAIAWTTFESWAEVGSWYRGLSGPEAPPKASLKARADQVIYGARTPEAKVRALYAFVAEEVRSIDVPFGQGSYAPQNASETLANMYGDSKDKAELLAAMLRVEGLPASTVLAGANEVDPKLPLPEWFGRVLTLTGDRETGEIWLDPLPEVAPFRMLQAPLRDRLALVIPARGEATLRRTPADLPFASENRFEAAGQVSVAGALETHVTMTLRGDDELLLRQAFRNGGPAEYDQALQYFLRGRGLGGMVTSTAAEGVNRLERPLRVTFDFSESEAGDWQHFRLAAPEPALLLPFGERSNSPETEIRLGGKRKETAISRLALPPGFSADLPPATHLHVAFASLDKTYRLEAGEGSDAQKTLVVERTFSVESSTLPPSDWPAYRKFLDGVRDSGASLQLTRGAAVGKGGPPPPGQSLQAAAELVSKAQEAIEAKDWKAASDRLDEARTLNPRQAFLWSSYGVIADVNGRKDEAIDDYRRELKEHPEEEAVSRRLAALLAQTGKTGEAIAVLRAAVALEQEDTQSVLMLAAMLARTDRAEAEKALRAGLRASEGSGKLRIALGNLLVDEGKRDEGAGLLAAAASASEDPGELNDAAYGLAEAGLNLPAAEQASRRSVQLLNIASLQRVNFPDEEAKLHFTLQLTASWDTYGWVLFKEGNLSEAEAWLRAGWMDSYRASAGKHFGLLLQRQGRAADASRVLRLAGEGQREEPSEAGNGSSGRQGAGPAPGASAGSAGSSSLAGAGLRAERTFAVRRPLGGAGGTATFDLEYAQNAPTTAQFVSGDTGLRDLGEVLAKVDTHTVIPTGSPAHVTRRGVLRCGAGPACALELLPALAAAR